MSKEYAILLETPGDIPGDYLERRKYNDEVIPYEVIDNDTKKSRVVNFTRVDVNRDLTVLENRKMLCASGPVYTKEFIEWPKSTKKRIEFKVSPKKEAAWVVKPVRVEKPIAEPNKITQTADHVPSTSQKESVSIVKEEEVVTTMMPFNISATDVPKVDEQQVAREAVSESVTYKNTDIKNNGTDNRKKKKKLVSETESTKRISMYHSTIRNELDGGHNNQPITRKYVLETTVTNKPVNNSSDEMESQPSHSNSIISLPPQKDQLNINSFCSKDREHVLFLKINVVMEHKVISRKGDTFFLPVITMEKQVEFDVHPNSINKSESVTLLSINQKWKNFLKELNRGKTTNNEDPYGYSGYGHYNGEGFSNAVAVDEATNYVTELQNSLESCDKFVKKVVVKKERQLRKRKINSNTADLPNADFPSATHTINQPTAKELQPTKKESNPDLDAKNKVVTDVKRNHSSAGYIIEELIDPQPSDTNSKSVVPGMPIKHVRSFKRVVIHGDDPENAQVEEYSEVGGDLESIAETTTIAPVAETVKIVPQTSSVPDITTVTKVVPIVSNRHASDDVPEENIFVKVLGTLSTILRRLAA